MNKTFLATLTAFSLFFFAGCASTQNNDPQQYCASKEAGLKKSILKILAHEGKAGTGLYIESGAVGGECLWGITLDGVLLGLAAHHPQEGAVSVRIFEGNLYSVYAEGEILYTDKQEEKIKEVK